LFRLLTGSGCVKVCAAASSAAEGENGQEKLSCNKLKRTQQISRTGLSKPQYVTIRQIETAKKQKTKTKRRRRRRRRRIMRRRRRRRRRTRRRRRRTRTRRRRRRRRRRKRRKRRRRRRRRRKRKIINIVIHF